MKKQKNIFKNLYPLAGIAALLIIWQLACSLRIMPEFMLPSPVRVARAFALSFPELMSHARISLAESFLGLSAGVAAAFIISFFMDRFNFFYRTAYPLLVISQAVPVVAIAPLLVLWFGYGLAPKIILITISCFFPVAVGLLNGLRGADEDQIGLLRAMGASKNQIFIHAKMPGALTSFFSGLKISVSFSIVGAVIAEWLGGSGGLGVYMTRVRKSYAYDRMFAVILLVSAISLLLFYLTALLEKKCTPWRNFKK